MKRIPVITLLLLLCLLILAGCGDSGAKSSTESDSEALSPQESSTIAPQQDDQGELKKNSDGLYEIYTAQDMVSYKEIVEEEMRTSGVNKHSHSGAILMADIDMSGVCSAELGSWDPIGLDCGNGKRYCSLDDTVFDGNGKTISHLYIESDDDAALFFELSDIEVKDITFTDCYIHSKTGSAATLASQIKDSRVTNITVDKNVTLCSDKNYAGGVVAYADGDRDNNDYTSCVNYADVSGGSYTGGIIGRSNNKINVYGCINYGSITGKTGVGGIIGINRPHGKIIGCINYGTVDEAGIAGINSGTLKFCVNAGAVEYDLTGTYYQQGQIDNCLNVGTVSKKIAAGMDEYNNKTSYSTTLSDPGLTDGTVLAKLRELYDGEGDNWRQGDEFPVWNGCVRTKPR